MSRNGMPPPPMPPARPANVGTADAPPRPGAAPPVADAAGKDKIAEAVHGSDLAVQALASLSQYGMSITPHTFAVWYEYHRGGIPELNRVVDILRGNRGSMTEEQLSTLHAKYLGGPEAYMALRGTSERMQQTITDMLAMMHDAGKDASRFNAAVRQVTGEFARQETSIEVLVRSLLNEAQDIIARTKQMEAELSRNAELMKSLQRSLDDSRKAALTDGLTGLSNRRHFDETMQRLAGHAMNDGGDLTLILLDIDHFKHINDTFGHPVGDQVLQLVGATVRHNLRPSDFAARYGGEEFAVLLERTNSQTAADMANRLREAFATNRVVIRESRQAIGTVTISAGVAMFRPGESTTDWLKRADTALYSAKHSGRNRVVQAA